MKDFAIIFMVLMLVWAAWLKPWVGVLGLAVLGILHPQNYGGALLRDVPVYGLLFVVTLGAALRDQYQQRTWPAFFWDWRLLLLGLLGAVFLASTVNSINPWMAWPHLVEVAKIAPPLLLLLWLINTREKLHFLLLAMGLSIAAVALKGGYWALITGFQDRVYGPPGSQIGGNNEFAIASAMALPLLMIGVRSAYPVWVRTVLIGAVVLGYVATLTSWSRGGLLSLAAVTIAMLAFSKRRHWGLAGVVVGMVALGLVMPETWFERMGTIGADTADASAQNRLNVWGMGVDFMRAHPLLGGGFEGWIFATLTQGMPLDWHNAYIEVGTEHGLLGLALWLVLLVGTMMDLALCAHLGLRKRDDWLYTSGGMLLAGMVAYVVGAMFLGIAYWEFLYWLLFCAIVLRRLAHPSHGRTQSNSMDNKPDGRPSNPPDLSDKLTAKSQ